MQDDRALLTIAISTIGNRLLNLKRDALPKRPGFRYVVVVQDAIEESRAELSAQILSLIGEPDHVRIRFSNRLGLAASRNAAMQEIQSDYVHFCDDDLFLDGDALGEAVGYLQERDRLGFVWLRSITPDGRLRKRYPGHETDLTMFNSGSVGTPELVFRFAPIRELGLRFDERFGAGSTFARGEEYIFLSDLLKNGVKGVHLTRTLFEHDWESTGNRNGGTKDIAARAAVIERVFGPAVIPMKIAYAARHLGLFKRVSDVVAFLQPNLPANRAQ